MNGVDDIVITIIREWVSDKLGLLNETLLSGSKAAFWTAKSNQSSQIIILEVNCEQQLGLEICWRFGNI